MTVINKKISDSLLITVYCLLTWLHRIPSVQVCDLPTLLGAGATMLNRITIAGYKIKKPQNFEAFLLRRN